MSLDKSEILGVGHETLESVVPQSIAPQQVTEEQPERGAGTLQSRIGNAAVAAAAINDPPANGGDPYSLHASYGNAAVARAFVQRKPEGEEVSGLAAIPTGRQPAAAEEPAAPNAATAHAGLIVDDTAQDLEPHQMKRSAFLSQLRGAVQATAEQSLSGFPSAIAMRPSVDQEIERQFRSYSGLDGRLLENTIRNQVPGARGATSAAALIPPICALVRRNIESGAPRTPSLVGSAAGAVASAVGSVAATAGSVVSGIGSLLFKAREGGAQRDEDAPSIRAQLGEGSSLDSRVQTGIASAFGQDFSGVRVHTDARAAQLADKLNARAFTMGSDIAFGASEYRPGTPIGDALIAHELAHVVQQRSAGPDSAVMPSSASREDAFETDADNAALGAVMSVWGRAQDGTRRIGKNAVPALKSGLKLRRCERDQPAPEVTPTPTHTPSTPAPRPAPPPRPLFEQFETGPERQALIDTAVREMGIDVSLLEGGRMFYNGTIPGGEAITWPPGDRDLLRIRRSRDPQARLNTKPFVEITPAAFGDGQPLLRSTIFHEYQHVLQMTRGRGMIIPGTNVRGHAQEAEAYCNEIIEAERLNLHLQTQVVTQTRDGGRLDLSGREYIEQVLWRRLNNHWRQADRNSRRRLAQRYSEARAAAERMVGHSL